MAIFHLTTKIHGLGSDPKLNALRSYAYRSGTKIIDPVMGRVYNFTSKQSEVVLTETTGVVKVVVAFLWVSQATFSVVLDSLFGAVVGLRCTASMGFQLRVEPDQRFGLYPLSKAGAVIL